jgi:redox-sensing transcriptional repressor
VRKDLAYFGQFGRPGVGYEVGPLIHRLRSILGTDRVSYTLLVGVGNIGRALARYQGFKSKGFELVALFDADPKKVGRKIGSMPIQPMEELESVVAQWGVRLAILAVPAETAQSVVDRLARTGLRGILNFAPTRLKAPAGVTVHNLDVAAELEQLSYMANHSTANQA